ncbi:MAG: hypothetical protein ABW136_01150 [Steroidobacteraceae bacterium]
MDESRTGGIGRIIRTYVDIVLFRSGPEDLPASQALLIITIAANVFLDFAASTALPMPGDTNQLIVAVVQVAFVLAWYWALLRLAGKPERFLQTATAGFGIQLVLGPLLVLVALAAPEPLAGAQTPGWIALPLVVLGVWVLAVGSRIVRAATQWPMAICVAATLLQAVLGRLLIFGLFPEVAGGAAATTV